MGREVDRALSAAHRFYGDSLLERYVHQVGLRLVAKCERPGLPWTFRVLDEPSLNAFAFTGGFIYVTRGMLAYLNSEAQLAAVLGHEIGHVTAGHAIDRSTRLGITSAGLVVGTAGGALAPTYGSMDRLQELLLARSRHAEQEADTLGLRYMSDAGYDPMEMLAVLHTVENAVGGPAWLASHPNPEHRIGGGVIQHLQLSEQPGFQIRRNLLGSDILDKEVAQPSIPERDDHASASPILDQCTTRRGTIPDPCSGIIGDKMTECRPR